MTLFGMPRKCKLHFAAHRPLHHAVRSLRHGQADPNALETHE